MICACCKKDLPADNFAAGLLKRTPGHWVCRPCKREQTRAYQQSHRDKIKEYCRRYEAENRDKRNAKFMLNRALKAGRIEKQPCAVCGETSDVHGHHFSYAQNDWLSVIWLCPLHHRAVHTGVLSVDGLPIVHGHMSTRMRKALQSAQ